MEPERKLEKRKNVIFSIVLFLLVVSIFYAVYMLFHAPSGLAEYAGQRVKSDYVLMVLQCLFGAIVIFLPEKVEDRFEVRIPNLIKIIYIIFLFLAIYLGEVRNFYFRVPHWDNILHFFSATMSGALGFFLVDYLNGFDKLNLDLSPFFVSFFAFCFSVTVGAIWEIYEFLADGILGTNMQKFITFQGEVLVGREAISDTMEDIIVNTLGALLIVTLGYFYLQKSQKPNKKAPKE